MDIRDEKILKQIRNILTSKRKISNTERIMSNPVTVKRLNESIR